MCATLRFPRSLRLRRRRDFAHLFGVGTRCRGLFMTLVVCAPATAAGGQTFAVVARKKEYRHAVDRNRVKRRLREVLRLHRHQLRENIWLAIQARPGVLQASWSALCADFLTTCRRAGLMLDNQLD
jgi:ribonuclease P protein component